MIKKILIADDHLVVRRGIRQILSDWSDSAVMDEACNGQEVLEKVQDNHYDLILLDISMPGRSGLEVLAQLKKERPDLNVLILSMHTEEQYAVRVMKAGASGYLTKESTPEELISAVERVSQGRKYISSSLAEQLAFYLETETEKPPHELLSDRQFEVLCLIAKGKTVTEIAEMLSLSIKTISTYRTRILEKMAMTNNAQLTHYAIKNNLVCE
jgi:DNA-binding NarL/FixJ family response regulator